MIIITMTFLSCGCVQNRRKKNHFYDQNFELQSPFRATREHKSMKHVNHMLFSHSVQRSASFRRSVAAARKVLILLFHVGAGELSQTFSRHHRSEDPHLKLPSSGSAALRFPLEGFPFIPFHVLMAATHDKCVCNVSEAAACVMFNA